jgi:RHS repeat-associated protein
MKKIFLSSTTATLLLLLASSNLSAAGKTKVDIIFAMDTSGSMSDEATALINSIQSVTNELSAEFDIDSKLWSITNSFDYSSAGFDSSVINEIPNHISNQYEDWGPAVSDISSKYTGWRNDTIKIIVPISDEGPENGDRCDEGDELAVTQARLDADNNNINVLPIIGSNSWGTYETIKQLASSLSTVNGKIITTSSSQTIDEDMKNALKEIIATTTGDLVLPPELGTYSINGSYINIPIYKAAGAKSINYIVMEGGTTIKDVISTDIEKISLEVEDNNNHTYTLKVRTVGSDSTNNTIYSDFVQKDINFIATKNLMLTCGNTPILAQCNLQKEKIVADIPILNPAKAEVKVEAQLGHASDPVDVTSGNFYLSQTDLIVKTAGVDFSVIRQYNSLDIQRGWGFNIVSTMDKSDINNIVVKWGNGSDEIFIKSENGWSSKYGASKLYTESGYYTVETQDKTKFKFSLDGKIAEVVDKKNLGYKYIYNGNNITIKDTFNNTLVDIYRDTSLHITELKDANANSIKYQYNGDDIISFTDRMQNTTTYTYTNNLVSAIIGPDTKLFVQNSYDEKGRVLTQKNAQGDITSFEYDIDDTTYLISKTTVTYPDGSKKEYQNSYNRVEKSTIDSQEVNYKYDKNGNISKVINQDGKVWEFVYDNYGNLAETNNPLGQNYKYTYDANGNMLTSQDPASHKVEFAYDANKNLVKQTFPDASSQEFIYNANNQMTKSIDQAGNEITYEYDAKGFLSKKTYPNNATVKYTYTSLGNISTIEDVNGNITTYKYDNNANVIAITDPLGNKVSYNYNGYGDLIEITDANGNKTTNEYNTDGLKTKTTFPDGSFINYKYDVLGRVIETSDALNRATKTQYDSMGRVSSVTMPNSKTKQYEYDTVGNLIKIIDENGNEYVNEFDDIGNIVKKYTPEGELQTAKTYNILGLSKTIKDGTNRDLAFEYDSLNRLTKATLTGDVEASAQYNARGLITKIKDPKGYETNFEYDALGNTIKETNPLSKVTTYEYNLSSQISKMTKPDGSTTQYKYDKIGNVSETTFSRAGKTNTTTYTYDKVYNPTSIKDNAGEIKYTYDNMGRVTSRTDIFGNKLQYSYNTVGKLSTLVYPDAKEVQYEYDTNNNLIKITDFNNNVVTNEYDAANNLSKTTYPNGMYTIYKYNSESKLLSVVNYNKAGKVITSNTLTRDSIGNIVSLDKKELLTPILDNIVSTNFVLDGANQIVSNNGVNFSYDDNGNLLKYSADNKDITLAYNEKEQLSSADIAGELYSYTYDAQNNRVSLKKGTDETRYVVDTVIGIAKPIAQTNSNNVIEKYFVYANNGLVYSINADNSIEIYLYDYKGDTLAIVDKDENILNSYTYSSYGKILNSIESVQNSYTYLGKHGVISDNKNLSYARARYYSNDLNRWTQMDTLKGSINNPLSLNRYALNEGDSVNFIDINGFYATNDYNNNWDEVGDELAEKWAQSEEWSLESAGWATANLFYSVGKSIADFSVKPAVNCKTNPGLNMDCTDVALSVVPGGKATKLLKSTKLKKVVVVDSINFMPNTAKKVGFSRGVGGASVVSAADKPFIAKDVVWAGDKTSIVVPKNTSALITGYSVENVAIKKTISEQVSGVVKSFNSLQQDSNGRSNKNNQNNQPSLNQSGSYAPRG